MCGWAFQPEVQVSLVSLLLTLRNPSARSPSGEKCIFQKLHFNFTDLLQNYVTTGFSAINVP